MLPATTTVSNLQTYIENVLGMTAARRQNNQLLRSLLMSESLQVILVFYFEFVDSVLQVIFVLTLFKQKTNN